jgi:hypothetical protein
VDRRRHCAAAGWCGCCTIGYDRFDQFGQATPTALNAEAMSAVE